MGEKMYFQDWAEELVDVIVISICHAISAEGGDDPVAFVEKEYGRLPSEQQFLLQFFIAEFRGDVREEEYEALAKQNIVDVWDALNFVP